MTTKPKARKFRIRRAAPTNGASNAAPNDAPPPMPPRQRPTGAPIPASVAERAARTTGKTGQIDSAANVAAENTIDAIRREGLTGRQLRMARRVAQKNGLAPVSDFDAVRLLRAKGVDPFQRANMLELVVPSQQKAQQTTAASENPLVDHGGVGGEEDQLTAQLPAHRPEGAGQVQLPQTMALGKQQLPSTELSPADRRAIEIAKIQRDIKARRRRKMMQLLTRLSVFVFLPTIMTGWYFFAMATPMYAVKSEFLILQADNVGGGGLGNLLTGSAFATGQDSTATQSYLQSKDAMIRLDQDVGFISHFSQDWIDPIQRLDTDASNEDAYKLYKNFVKIGYDPTEGVIRMEVAAADPQVATVFSKRLIAYAESRIDELSLASREDSMATAQVSLERAKKERRAAQIALVRLQEGTFIDPEGVIAAMRTQINNIEVQLQEKELLLEALQDNARPNQAKVDGAKGDVRRLKSLLGRLRAKMTDATTGEASLAESAIKIQMAQADLATADLFLQSALTNEKQTALEANRQVRYLTTSVRPVPSQDPTYPRAFENTILAFLIFSGIYLMISLTASILREQVSS
ncbi:MAG: capsule biosynthesis protein [Rhodobacterales bacterium]|nr:capsule biosynthesis protein [Rhodobacterales bacterium]